MSDGWISVKDELPTDSELVNTKIDDGRGARNEQPLKRYGPLWFLKDGSMYVYYEPTHWQPLPAPPKDS
jgi:hypothetical protein